MACTAVSSVASMQTCSFAGSRSRLPSSSGKRAKALPRTAIVVAAAAAEEKSEAPAAGGEINHAFSSPLLRTPLSGGVQNVSSHFELPSNSVAARNLMEQAMYGDLCTCMSPMDNRRAGWPVASLVDFATDAEGTPIFSLSPMAMHTRNMNADPRCSLVVEMPGWRGLASARVTIFGCVRPVPKELEEDARALFREKHQVQDAGFGTSDFPLYMLTEIRDIYFVGGYGTVCWIPHSDYRECRADKVVDRYYANPLETVAELNRNWRKDLPKLYTDSESTKIVSIDRLGMDVRVRTNGHILIQRVRFHGPVDDMYDANKEIAKIFDIGFKSKLPITGEEAIAHEKEKEKAEAETANSPRVKPSEAAAEGIKSEVVKNTAEAKLTEAAKADLAAAKAAKAAKDSNKSSAKAVASATTSGWKPPAELEHVKTEKEKVKGVKIADDNKGDTEKNNAVQMPR